MSGAMKSAAEASAFAFCFANAGSDPPANVDDCRFAEVTELHRFTPGGDLARALQPASLDGVIRPLLLEEKCLPGVLRWLHCEHK